MKSLGISAIARFSHSSSGYFPELRRKSWGVILAATLAALVLPLTPANAANGITSITPAIGLTAGGTPVTIFGTGFNSTDSLVSIGGVSATVTARSATSIKATTGVSKAVGVFDVVVTSATDRTTFKLPGGFTYIPVAGMTKADVVYALTITDLIKNMQAKLVPWTADSADATKYTGKMFGSKQYKTWLAKYKVSSKNLLNSLKALTKPVPPARFVASAKILKLAVGELDQALSLLISAATKNDSKLAAKGSKLANQFSADFVAWSKAFAAALA